MRVLPPSYGLRQGPSSSPNEQAGVPADRLSSKPDASPAGRQFCLDQTSPELRCAMDQQQGREQVHGLVRAETLFPADALA